MEAAASDIPSDLIADPVLPEVIWERGSLGSPVLALRGGHPEALECIANLYAKRFRKEWRDLKQGVAVFMAPAMSHESRTRNAEHLVTALCVAQDIPVVSLRATTLRGRKNGDEKKGNPDESFFIGEKAERYLAMERRDGIAAADEAFTGTPADLAVEVEHTHYDGAKRAIYREAGVTELWEMGTARSGKAPVIIDLRAPDGPRPVTSSSLIAGVRADGLDGALDVLRTVGGLVAFAEAKGRGERVAKRLLDVAGRAPRD